MKRARTPRDEFVRSIKAGSQAMKRWLHRHAGSDEPETNRLVQIGIDWAFGSVSTTVVLDAFDEKKQQEVEHGNKCER